MMYVMSFFGYGFHTRPILLHCLPPSDWDVDLIFGAYAAVLDHTWNLLWRDLKGDQGCYNSAVFECIRYLLCKTHVEVVFILIFVHLHLLNSQARYYKRAFVPPAFALSTYTVTFILQLSGQNSFQGEASSEVQITQALLRGLDACRLPGVTYRVLHKGFYFLLPSLVLFWVLWLRGQHLRTPERGRHWAPL